MSEAPERIWAFEDEPGGIPRGGWWCDEQSECPNGSPEYIRAGLVPAPSVTVKPLEWEEIHAARSDEDPTTEFTGEFEAECLLGVYSITMGFGSDCYYWGVTTPDGEELGNNFEDPLYAKAAAQADYEARIMAAIQIDPAPGWQPIETAPRDTKNGILGYYDAIPGVFHIAWYEGQWVSFDGEITNFHQPSMTHWMPLPAPPIEGVEP